MKNDLLNHIKIGTPCQTNWNEMGGTEKLRFCEQCQLHVHNLSAMSEQETAQLLLKSKGRVCGRIEYTFSEPVPAGFSSGIIRRLHHFANGLKVGVAALIGFVGLSSTANAQTAKANPPRESKPSVTQSAKRGRQKQKKSAKVVRITTMGIIQRVPMAPYEPLKPKPSSPPAPSLELPAQKAEEPPPPKKPDGNQNR